MLTPDEVNELCRAIADETAEESLERMYFNYLKAKFAEADAMEYAAHSYDNDAIEYGVK